MQGLKQKTSILPQRTLVALIQSTIWMGGICTIFDCFAYSLPWLLLPHSLDTDFSLLLNFSSDDIPCTRLELACGNELIMSKKLFSVLDSLLRSYREPIPYTFALFAKDVVSISEDTSG